MNLTPEKAVLQTRQYWYMDGLVELSVGAVFLLFALFSGLQALAEGTPWAAALGLLYPFFLLGSMLLLRRVVSGLKARLTYPRTGFVSYRQPSSRRRVVTFFVAALISIGLTTFLIRTGISADAWLSLLMGVTFALVLLFIAPGLGRFMLLAGISLLVGVGLYFSPWQGTIGLSLFFALMGLAQLISGGLTLRTYLRAYPLEAQDE